MKYFFLLIFITITCIVRGQDLSTLKAGASKAEQVILNDTDFKAMVTFYGSGSKKTKNKLIADIKANPNIYIPPVLFNMSMFLLIDKKYGEACFWFYAAQLRARYDVNRSVDKTVSAADWNGPIGMAINQYAFEHLDTLEKMIPKVIDL